MNSAEAHPERLLLADWLLLALVALLPLMKPTVDYPVIAADLVFPILVAAVALEVVTGRRRFRWNTLFAILAAYVLSLAPSLLASAELGTSAFKLATEFYLTGLAAITLVLVRSEAMLKRVTLTWLAATAVLVLLCLASLIAFAVDPNSALYQYARFQFGSLPPGHYPRLSFTFFNANMACNYLTVSLGLLALAWQRQWIARPAALALLAGILVAACSTISPDLGGVALALGIGAWFLRRSRLALGLAIAVALAFIAIEAFTPFLYPTAPFVIAIPGTNLVLAPACRFLTWIGAFTEFLRHPLLGHGIGIDATEVHFLDPAGGLHTLTDAHNVFLNIAAQTGIVGLAGLAVLVGYAARLTFSRAPNQRPLRLLLGLTFLNAFVYQGIGGSFEDTRHLWVLLGLVAAAARLPVSPAGGNNRTAGAPSPC